MKEAYISYETAKIAKEKGFDINSGFWYTSNGTLRTGTGLGEIQAPTQSLLTKYLREKHNIIVSIIPHFYGSYSSPTVKYRYKIMTHEDITEFDKYEDCLEMGLLEALNEIKT